MINKTFYKTLAEASEAVKKLGITKNKDYSESHHLDPRLPANPWTYYRVEWIDWYDFVGTRNPNVFYSSLKEASKAATALSIKNRAEYLKRYKEDKFLPSEPQNTYKSSWKGWAHFLKQKAIELLTDYKEAKSIASKQNFNSWQEYHAYRKKDPRLPHYPKRFYGDSWVSSNDFFGVQEPYPTLQAASKAAAKLKITTSHEYKQKRHLDPRLPKVPSTAYKDEWKGWYVFFEKRTNKYKTLTQAKIAAQALQARTMDEYKKLRHLDKALPPRPELTYKNEWVSSYDFLGKEAPEYYKTFQEAKDAVARLKIVNARDYHRRYKIDPLLPSNVQTYYREDWVSWNDFLNKPSFYSTCKEASESARRLGATTLAEYHKLRKLDPRLPYNVYKAYRGEITTIKEFLGSTPVFYEDYEQARKAIINLGITNSIEYRKRYKEDPHLPYKPHLIYPVDWNGWRAYLSQSPKIEDLQFWMIRVSEWTDRERNIDSKIASIRDFVENTKVPIRPELMLISDFNFNYNKYCKLVSSLIEARQKHFHNHCTTFFDWLIENFCAEENDEGDIVALPGYKNPLRNRKLAHLELQSTNNPRYQTNKPALPFIYIVKARNFLFPEAATTFGDVAKVLTEIFPSDWVDTKESNIDRDDPNCVYRKTDKGKFQLWNPSRAVALYTLLMVPLRGQQILWLDSGEADESTPVVVDNQIVLKKNDNHLATRRRIPKGAVQCDSQGNLSMYVTTNKTGRSFGGYTINYIPVNLAKWLVRLRDWQSNYNRIKRPMAWTDVNLPRKINLNDLKQRGHQCFLFRRTQNEIFSTSATFYRHLARVLYEIQGDDELVTKNKEALHTHFTPHSMRVSLITAYIIDGGVPISIISKLVGHASIVMTIYYTKISQSKMRQELDKAEKKLLLESTEAIQTWAMNNQIETAKSQLYSKDENGFDSLSNSWPASSYQFSDKGICPKSGLGCDTGWVDESESTKSTAVPEGYLGRRNCVRCKYFITGPAFIGGLQALANEISLEINVLAKEYLHHESVIKELEDEKFDCESESRPFARGNELIKAQCHFEQKAVKLDAFIGDLLSTTKLVKASLTLIKTQTLSTAKKQLVTKNDTWFLDFELEESGDNLRLANNICEDATIYQSVSYARALPIRSQILDRVSANLGLQPFLFKLSDEEQLIVGNQYIQLLKERLKTWDNIHKLVNNSFSIDSCELSEIEYSLKEISPTFQTQSGD